MNKISWPADARSIDVSQFDIENYVAKTSKVKDFVDGSKTIVAAPKGYGKTLLLKYIFHSVTENHSGYISIPNNQPIDSFQYEISLDVKKITHLSQSRSWETLWLTSIGLSVILNYGYESNDAELLSALLEKLEPKRAKLSSLVAIVEIVLEAVDSGISLRSFRKAEYNPTSILTMLLSTSLSNLLSSIASLGDTIYQLSIGVEKTTFVFIDQIDQAIRGYPLEVWQASQVGFVGAVYRLFLSNKHIKIYGSIRKEAWDSRKDELASQFQDCVVELTYTFEEMRRIFEKGIEAYETASTVTSPGLFKDDPISSFLGVSEYVNQWSGTTEDPFEYMFRHTLRRPRDIILMGEKIHQLSAEGNLNIESFASAVNDIPGEEINSQYFNETQRFTHNIGKVDYDKLFNRIHKNVFTKSELVEICSVYNRDIECIVKTGRGDCRDCLGANHIFCDLYRVGLLGVIDRDVKNDAATHQHFELAGRVRSKHLPDSEYYLIHPALEYCIKNIHGNKFYTPVRGILIGYKEFWPEKYDTLMLINNLESCLKSSGLNINNPLLQDVESLAKAIISENFEERGFEERVATLRSEISSDGLLSASNFLNNMINCVDSVSKYSQWLA